MLLKSLEFKNDAGQKVKINEIPVLEKDSPHYFLIQVRLQSFISSLYRDKQPKECYSFRDYLKKALKWPIYQEIFQVPELKNNA